MKFLLILFLTHSIINLFGLQIQIEDHGFLLWWVKFVPRIDVPGIQPVLLYEGSVNKFYIFAGYFRKLLNKEISVVARSTVGPISQDLPLELSRTENGNLIFDLRWPTGEEQQNGQGNLISFEDVKYDGDKQIFYVYIKYFQKFENLKSCEMKDKREKKERKHILEIKKIKRNFLEIRNNKSEIFSGDFEELRRKKIEMGESYERQNVEKIGIDF